MALAEALKEVMEARGLRPAEVARRLSGEYDRATLYSMLKGDTTQPRMGTLIALCRALELSPTELLQRAELWPYRERSEESLDLQLRTVYARLRVLPREERQRMVAIVSCLATTWATGQEDAACT